MSDDFGTMNVRRGAAARELDTLRRHYREHREALTRMSAEAPTESLASEYARLIRSIDDSLAKLDELERGTSARPAAGAPRTAETPKSQGDPLRDTEPAYRPPAPPPGTRQLAGEPEFVGNYEGQVPRGSGGSRVALMIAAAVFVIAVVGWLVWRASSSRRAAAPVVTETNVAETAPPLSTQPVTPAPAPVAALAVSPATADFGAVRKGTRAVRQIEVTNGGSTAVQYQVARSQCRCLYYEYKGSLAPKGKETVTVTVDAAKAKAGTLTETIPITIKGEHQPAASFSVTAAIR